MTAKESNSKYRYLAKNSILFTISSFGSKILSFLLVPLYTYVLTTYELGLSGLVVTSSSLLVFAVTINIGDAVLRFAMDKANDPHKIMAYGIRVIIRGTLIFSALSLIAYGINVIPWPRYCYLYLFLIVFVNSFLALFQNYLRSVDKVKDVAVSGVINTMFVIVSNLVFLLVLKIGIIGYFASMVIGPFVALIYCIIRTDNFREIVFGAVCDKETQREMRRYSIPLIFNGIAWWVNSSLDKYFVTAICGVSQNGIYDVSSKIPGILSTFNGIFSQAWSLSAIKEFDRADEDGFFSKTYNSYNACLVLICSVLIVLNIPLATLLFQKESFEAWNYSSLLLVAMVFNSMSGFTGSVFSAVKDSRSYAVTTITGAIVNTVLNFVLIINFQVIGAAIATIVSFAVTWFSRYILTRKYIMWKVNICRDILAYSLLLLQVSFEHLSGHFYIGQLSCLLLLLVIYFSDLKMVLGKCMVTANKMLGNRLKGAGK